MFGIGGFELFIIILFGFLVFGPDKLPEVAKTVGMAINKFKKAKEEMDGVIKEEVFDPTADEPFKNPAKAIDKAHGVVKEKFTRSENEETFAERKARFEREREAQRKRAEIDQKKQQEINANRAKMKEEAAAKAAESAQEEAAGSQPAAKPTADELYGNAPVNKEFVRPKKDAPAKAAPVKEASDKQAEPVSEAEVAPAETAPAEVEGGAQ